MKVFISYSHDSDEHAGRMLKLANRLVREGVDTILDQYEQSPPEGWPRWMDDQIQDARFVLMVCTEPYHRRVMGREKPKTGLGVRWEGNLIYQHLYDADTTTRKFIPILLEGGRIEDIPLPVRGATHYRVDTQQGYQDLYRRLTDQPRVRKPEIGPRTELSTEGPRHERPSAADAPERDDVNLEPVTPPLPDIDPRGLLSRGRRYPSLQFVAGKEDRSEIRDGPVIRVSLEPEANYARLKVTNIGVTARFQATATKRQAGAQPPPWPVKWRGSYSKLEEIIGGASQFLDLASLGRTFGVPNDPIIKFHTARQEVEPGIGEQEAFADSVVLGRHETDVVVDIEILSEPPMRRPFRNSYRVALTPTGDNMFMEPWPDDSSSKPPPARQEVEPYPSDDPPEERQFRGHELHDVFICHASEDKDAFARPLAEALQEAGLRVWFDEFTLTLGDSLSESIDRGIATSRYGVVVLSKAFFAKKWPRHELNALTTKDVETGKTILPVWHGVTREDVAGYSPNLADKLAVSTDDGLGNVVSMILQVLRPESGGARGPSLEPTRSGAPQSQSVEEELHKIVQRVILELRGNIRLTGWSIGDMPTSWLERLFGHDEYLRFPAELREAIEIVMSRTRALRSMPRISATKDHANYVREAENLIALLDRFDRTDRDGPEGEGPMGGDTYTADTITVPRSGAADDGGNDTVLYNVRKSAIPWINRPGGPEFRLYPTVDGDGRLLCSFRIDATLPPGGVEAKWTGAGTDMDWTKPMQQNVPANYREHQMKPASMSPSLPQDKVTFHVRFYLEDGLLHGGYWVWPLNQQPGERWELAPEHGSGLRQPPLDQTW